VRDLRPALVAADACGVSSLPALPRADRLTVWPIKAGEYGLDATWHGASGYGIAQKYDAWLSLEGVRHQFRREDDGGWTLRLGPLPAQVARKAIDALVR
jgi:hypothetical protein